LACYLSLLNRDQSKSTGWVSLLQSRIISGREGRTSPNLPYLFAAGAHPRFVLRQISHPLSKNPLEIKPRRKTCDGSTATR
jgi:hypothetical protein